MRPLALLVCVFALVCARPAAAQFPYPSDFGPYAVEGDGPGDDDVTVHTVLISMATLTTIGFNLSDQAPHWAGPAGFLGGTLQVVYATRQKQDGVATMVNYFVGGAAVLTSLSRLARGDEPKASGANGVQVTPLLAWDDERRPLAGASVRF